MSNRASDLQVEVTLTAFSIGYKPQNLIAEQVLPVVPHGNETGIYWVWDKESAFTIPNTLRADGTRPNTVDTTATKKSFAVEEYAVDVPITDREEKNADGILRLRQNKTRRGQDAILVDQERRVANALRTQLPSTSLTGTAKWSSADNSFIEAQIDDAKEAIRIETGGLEPNTIIIPRPITRHAKRNSTIRDLIKYTASDLLVNGELPPYMFGLKVLVPGALTNNGTTAVTLSDVWGNDIIIAHVADAPELDTPSLGYIIRNGAFTTYQWRDDSISTNYVRPTVLQDELITFAGCGYVLKDVL